MASLSFIREVVLSKVDAMVKEFVYRASLARGLSESLASTSGGKIFSFVRIMTSSLEVIARLTMSNLAGILSAGCTWTWIGY